MRFCFVCLFLCIVLSHAKADLKYEPVRLNQGQVVLLVSGTFEYEDDLTLFITAVKAHNPFAVTFNSGGGNVLKAIQLGRMIRLLELNSMQLRGSECSSACALAFLGGVHRFAQAGAIGVHKSSFSDSSGLNVRDAVSSVQQLTADVMMYITEMGADANLLQLSLRYDSDDMRYLSLREMENYNVVTKKAGENNNTVQQQTAAVHPVAPQSASHDRSYTKEHTQYATKPNFNIPTAASGFINHPKGKTGLKLSADNKSRNQVELRNGDRVILKPYNDRWYWATSKNISGYLHHTWVKVDQFEVHNSSHRFIQISSFEDYDDALDYINKSDLDLSIYLSSNRWLAITLTQTFTLSDASIILKNLKAERSIPMDSMITIGNPYVRKLCCN